MSARFSLGVLNDPAKSEKHGPTHHLARPNSQARTGAGYFFPPVHLAASKDWQLIHTQLKVVLTIHISTYHLVGSHETTNNMNNIRTNNNVQKLLLF